MASLLDWFKKRTEDTVGGIGNQIQRNVVQPFNNQVVRPFNNQIAPQINRQVVRPFQNQVNNQIQNVQRNAPRVAVDAGIQGLKRINPVLGESAGYGVKNFDRPIPKIDVTPRQVSAQLPQATRQTVGGIGTGAKAVGGALLYGPIQTANVINYPITEKQARTELEKGNIKYDTYKQVVDEAMSKAGINPQDKGLTLARKTSAPIAMTTLDILTAGALPGKFKALSTPKGILQNTKAGAGLGAVYGGLNVAGQKEKITPQDVVTNVVGGTAAGGILGGGSSALVKGGRKAIGYDALDDITKQAGIQKQLGALDKAVPHTAPDLPTKGKMLSEGYQNVKVDFNSNQPQLPVGTRIADTAPKNPLDDLANEARKYKSAEEFMDNISSKNRKLINPEDGGIYFHGTTKENYQSLVDNGFNPKLNKKGFAEQPEGFHLGDSYEAGMYGEKSVAVKAKDGVKVKTISRADFTADQNASFKTGKDEINFARKAGYDAINAGDEIIVVNPNKFEIKTRQHLTDLYNQATKNKPIYEMAPKPSKQELKTVKSGFPSTVKSSSEVSPELKAMVKKEHVVATDKQALENTDKLFKGGVKKAQEDIMLRLDNPTAGFNKQTISDGIALMKRLDYKGDTVGANAVHDKLSDILTNSGQTSQAASLLKQRTPEGLLYSARQVFKKADIEPSKQQIKEIKKLINEVSKAKGDAKDYKIAEMSLYLQRQIPAQLGDKVVGAWKAGLLTGLRTQTGNTTSNLTFGALHKISDPGAVLLDRVMSKFTGQRTKALSGKDILTGGKEGVQKGVQLLKSGVDERNLSGKIDLKGEIQFKNKGVRTLVNGVFRVMGAADRPFYYAQLRNSLAELGKVEGINKGLKGKALKDYTENFIVNAKKGQVEEAVNIATKEAEKQILANETALSKIAASLLQLPERSNNRILKQVGHIMGSMAMPFTRVPSAFINRVIDFSPAGGLKEIINQVGTKNFNQRQLATAISESTTGTGIIALGLALANNGLLSGNYPKDRSEAQRWKAEGIQPNSIKLGGKWYNLNYAGPLGLLFNIGNRINEGMAEKKNFGDIALQSSIGTVQDTMNQSFLQGVQGIFDAIGDPERSAKKLAMNYAGSVVPTFFNDLGQAIDPLQRQANNIPDAFVTRVPGLRQTLMPKIDVFGNELKRKTDPISTMINPYRPSNEISNSMLDEVNRLRKDDINVTPVPITNTLSFNNQKTVINDKQKQELQKRIGQRTQDAWNQIIESDKYKNLSNFEQGQILENTASNIAQQEKLKYGKENGFAGANEKKDVTNKDYLNPQNTKKAKKTAIKKSLPKAKKAKKGRVAKAKKLPKVAFSKGSKMPTIKGVKVKKVKTTKIAVSKIPKIS